jgi:FkbM family methyltransferase
MTNWVPADGLLSSQEIYEKMLFDTIKGMNICGSEYPNENGERNAAEYVSKKICDDAVIFDCGANVGIWSIMAREVFGEKRKIYAFEPNSKTYEVLLENVQGKGIIPVRCAVSSKEGTEPIFSNGDLSGLTSLYHRRLNHFGIDMNFIGTVQTITIDEYCRNESIKTIDFLKLDIEGHEYNALSGASNMFGEIRFIQFEFGGCNIDSRTYFQDFWYLLKNKYKIYRIVKDGLFEIKEYKEYYELFMMTNFLCELK